MSFNCPRGLKIAWAACLVLGIASAALSARSAAAGVTWSCTRADAGSGLVRYVFRFASDDLPIAGFALRFVSPRLHNLEPHGLATLFQDNNAAFSATGQDAGQDTQWLFRRFGKGPLRIYVAPNDLTVEAPSMISGDFELRDKSAHERDAIQVVVPAADAVRFLGVVGIHDGRPGSLRRKERVHGRVGPGEDGPAVPGLPARTECSEAARAD